MLEKIRNSNSFDVFGFGRRDFKDFKKYCERMRNPFGSSVHKKVILRQLREYDLPKIKTLRQILRFRFWRNRRFQIRKQKLRRESRVGSRRHFVEWG